MDMQDRAVVVAGGASEIGKATAFLRLDDDGLKRELPRFRQGRNRTMSIYRSPIPAAVLLIALAAPVEAQVPPDPGAAANIREGQAYEQALRSNSAFRAKRMQQECGPITDPELHASCVSSFQANGQAPASRKRQQ